jgi:hypothetical protein
MLPHLLHTVYASNSFWWLAVPTAARNRISICFHTFKVFIWLTLVYSSCKCRLLNFHLILCTTAHHMPTAFQSEMRMKLSLSHKSPPFRTNLACLISSQYSDIFIPTICIFDINVRITLPHTSGNMHHFSLLLSQVSKSYPKDVNACIIFQTIKFSSKNHERNKILFETQALNHGFFVSAVYHKLLKLVTEELLMWHDQMSWNDSGGHKSVTEQREAPPTASL